MPRSRRQLIRTGHRLRVVPDPGLILRFIRKVKVDRRTGCWVWQARKDDNGYGQISYRGQARGAHRVAYAMFVRTIAPGTDVDHTCHNPSCVNPAHLRQKDAHANAFEGGKWRHNPLPPPKRPADTGDDIPF